jgi:Tol biopolymer transport system component
LGVLVVLLMLPAGAAATFPGKNGKIAFNSGGSSPYIPGNTIEVINPDGTGRATLTTGTDPAWSPDGNKIAFFRGRSLYVAAADGSGATEIFTSAQGFFGDPAWSPDAAKIAFVRFGECNGTSGDCDPNSLLITNADGSGLHSVPVQPNPEGWPLWGAALNEPDWSPDGTRFVGGDDILYGDRPRAFIMDVDGTDFRYLTPGWPNTSSYDASWSPDGSRIALVRTDSTHRVVSIRPDGSNQIQMWPGFVLYPPAWSPDGSRVLLVPGGELVLVDPDGGNPVQLTHDGGVKGNADWQPLPVNGYPRPRSATGLDVSLVPAYSPCTAPNRQHGPPLAYDSCHPPAGASDEATLGSPDANGRPAKGQGVARYAALGTDVRITFEAYDVYDHASLADYAGELRLRSSLRITDKRNTPHPGGPGAATVSDTSLGATVPCTASGDTTTGSSCLLTTTVNALAPGTVTAGARTVWELGQVQVDDGGADGDADTAGDNTLFMVQGVFVP